MKLSEVRIARPGVLKLAAPDAALPSVLWVPRGKEGHIEVPPLFPGDCPVEEGGEGDCHRAEGKAKQVIVRKKVLCYMHCKPPPPPRPRQYLLCPALEQGGGSFAGSSLLYG